MQHTQSRRIREIRRFYTPLEAALQDVFSAKVVHRSAVKAVGVAVWPRLQALRKVELGAFVVVSL
jgi:hypothetical protein